jgi:glycosyltransferase involved in cell wall biosynthesis
MSHPPRVTVIIPNYNHARFLEQRLSSVLNQTFTDIEVLYLDDASTDESNAVVARFADDPRLRMVCNETNSGSPFKQWNRGVKMAQGEYIWIAESDDNADAHFLEELVPMLDAHPRAGLAYCQSWRINEHNEVILLTEDLNGWMDEQRWKHNFVNDGSDECRRYLVRVNTIPNASAVLFRREVYERAGYADETLRVCGDWLTWVRLLRISDIAYVAKPLNYHRLHQATVRKKMDGNPALAETYRVICTMFATFDVPPEIRAQVVERYLDKWSRNMDKFGVRRNRNWHIYRIARTITPALEWRLARKLLLLWYDRHIDTRAKYALYRMRSRLHLTRLTIR